MISTVKLSDFLHLSHPVLPPSQKTIDLRNKRLREIQSGKKTSSSQGPKEAIVGRKLPTPKARMMQDKGKQAARQKSKTPQAGPSSMGHMG
jgi:hypothetical protein